MPRGNGFQANGNSLLFGSRKSTKIEEPKQTKQEPIAFEFAESRIYTEQEVENWALDHLEVLANIILDHKEYEITVDTEYRYENLTTPAKAYALANSSGIKVSIEIEDDRGNVIQTYTEIIGVSDMLEHLSDYRVEEDVIYALNEFYGEPNA